MLRDQVFVLDHMYMSLFTTCGWILRLGVTVALLVSIHPALALLAVFALPTVFTSTWRPEVERTAEERGAWANRLARHLFDLATTAPPGKEVRVTGIGRASGQRAARGLGALVPARGGGAVWHGALAHAGLGDFRRRLMWRRLFSCRPCMKASPGSVLLVLAAGSRFRRTSARRWAKSASCAASGWTARSGWRGWRITPHRCNMAPTRRRPNV